MKRLQYHMQSILRPLTRQIWSLCLKISARQSFSSGDNLTVSHLCPLRRNSAVARLDLVWGGGWGAVTSAELNRNENIEPKSSVKSVGADQVNVPVKAIGGEGEGQAPSAPPHATVLRKKS